ncbi:hypothetical protein [Microbispora sp. H11081]|uniref:hypothetical protein n=1 Tax=Microbispora sp. H11081 TaxID=2729107 RepID=UPI0014762447|nr:hypothetical protein [Microbispora sp. H11081]
MKRIISSLAVATGVLGATLTGVSPASAATTEIDCTTGGYTYVKHTYALTNYPWGAVDGRNYNIVGSPYNYEICLDVPDGTTFTIEIRKGEAPYILVDDRPGDKIFTFTADTWYQVHGTLSGPPSTYFYYTWYEKRSPARSAPHKRGIRP